MKHLVNLVKLGRCGYAEAYSKQMYYHKKLVSDVNYIKDNPDTKIKRHENSLILVEHNPVYTIGIRDKSYTKDIEKKLTESGAEFVRSDRGGLITFHGPGQLVAYPILYLGDFDPKRSIANYVHKLEDTIVDMCQTIFNDNCRTNQPKIGTLKEHPGVWIDDQRKIAAIGVRASRYVTMHGIAINCDVDLKWYDQIVPCGIEGKEVTTLSKELNSRFTLADTIPHFLHSFETVFNCSIKK